MLDTIESIETPEGAIIQLRLAGPVVRSLAWLADFLIRSIFYLLFSLLLGWMNKLGTGIMLILVFLLEWFYPVVFEVMNQGATPGKKVFNLSVLQDNGTPVGWTSSIIRNLLRAADFLPFFYGCGLVSMLFNRHFKRLGDIAAHTVVVYKNRAKENVMLPPGKAAVPLALPFPLTAEEQQLLISFALRSSRLSPERIEELAAILSSLNPTSASHAEQLLGYARFYAGYHESA